MTTRTLRLLPSYQEALLRRRVKTYAAVAAVCLILVLILFYIGPSIDPPGANFADLWTPRTWYDLAFGFLCIFVIWAAKVASVNYQKANDSKRAREFRPSDAYKINVRTTQSFGYYLSLLTLISLVFLFRYAYILVLYLSFVFRR